jgi:hypothetical protein
MAAIDLVHAGEVRQARGTLQLLTHTFQSPFSQPRRGGSFRPPRSNRSLQRRVCLRHGSGQGIPSLTPSSTICPVFQSLPAHGDFTIELRSDPHGRDVAVSHRRRRVQCDDSATGGSARCESCGCNWYTLRLAVAVIPSASRSSVPRQRSG